MICHYYILEHDKKQIKESLTFYLLMLEFNNLLHRPMLEEIDYIISVSKKILIQSIHQSL